MKKLLLFFAMILLPIMASAYDAYINGICYNFDQNRNTAEVTYYSAVSKTNAKVFSGKIDIPATVEYNGVIYSVTSIGTLAFRDCSAIASVSVPNSVTSIGDNAFEGCNGLTSVSIPNSVTSIGHSAFSKCSSLTSVTIGNSVTTIGSSVFYGCSSLTSVNIPNSVTSIGGSAFYGTGWYNDQPDGILYLDNWVIDIKGEKPIGKIDISEGTVGIAGYVFTDCNDLTSITIPNSVSSIGYGAFSGCRSLKSITIPNRVASIEQSTFTGCWSLTSITIPSSVTSIGDQAFQQCSALASITIPNSLTSIGENAFNGCRSLESIIIPNSVTTIGSRAFYDCSGLVSVTFPNSITNIGGNVFYNCGIKNLYISDLSAWCSLFSSSQSLPIISSNHHLYLNGVEVEHLTLPDNITSLGNYVFYGCSYITSVAIPNSVTSIGERAFENLSKMESLILPDELQIIRKASFKGCRSLKSISIPATVEIIFQEAFANCYGLESVVALPETPPFLYDDSFSNYDIVLSVPETSKEAYMTTSPWSKFTTLRTLTGKDVEKNKCAKPVIIYKNGKLTFNCDTEGAVCQSTITDTDISSYSSNDVQLSVTYHISVYATKTGYENSETATATLCWIDVEPKTEGITNGVANVRALPLLIQSNGNTLTVSGADDGTPIIVYSINGIEAGSAISQNGAATIPTTLQSSCYAIVKVGKKSIKVVMK